MSFGYRQFVEIAVNATWAECKFVNATWAECKFENATWAECNFVYQFVGCSLVHYYVCWMLLSTLLCVLDAPVCCAVGNEGTLCWEPTIATGLFKPGVGESLVEHASPTSSSSAFPAPSAPGFSLWVEPCYTLILFCPGFDCLLLLFFKLCTLVLCFTDAVKYLTNKWPSL